MIDIYGMLLEAEILAAKRTHCLELLVHPDVVGVGVGIKTKKKIKTGRPCITIYVPKKIDESELDPTRILPKRIGGIITDVVEFGLQSHTIRLKPAPGLGVRHRPVPVGVSIGHFALQGAGTVGGYFKDKKTGDVLLMSAWHVLTNYGLGKKGDEIIQPALIDGGTKEKDTVAYLEKWIDVKMIGHVLGEGKSNLKAYIDRNEPPPLNRVDVAFAKPVSEKVVPKQFMSTGKAKIGNNAIFVGRTSGVSKGKVIDTNATVWVEYTGYGVALFDDVAISQGESLPGDSGAPIFISRQ